MFLYISPHRDDIRRSGSLAVLMDDQQYCLRSHEIVHAVDERPSFLLSFFLALQVTNTALMFYVETHEEFSYKNCYQNFVKKIFPKFQEFSGKIDQAALTCTPTFSSLFCF